ncbi:type II toxin-antitoxin system RelE/ParE family toxin [Ciceribacter sp. L1K23]|uniref:type II toxin-antitoxin system RelE/ParE family toxin n=1 Tax=Ciceribacter sp. L1K23 TaxID=2820276 RepID=UPI001B8228DA|nr:type II toxin-antitoxin system RelE/ParE family toxin [Ciceribacter sp. L1K23]MBR0556665.1 type II toxin-antitoxin system RelE/ParE family toxin [Ciceribacter sp. L1K23]
MKALALSPAAEADLNEIWDYSAAAWGVDRADRYIDDIRDGCERLCFGTIRGRPADIRTGYLKHAVGSHMIYFRSSSDRVEIIRILHQRQDANRNLAGY